MSHPYFPRNADIRGFIPNTIPVINILVGFFGACTLLMYFGWSLTANRKMTRTDRLATNWFLLCGAIHTLLEGYFVTFARNIAADPHPLAQVWKEYAHSDSRYLTGDPTVWSVEALTAYILGPACFVTVYSLVNKKNYRHAFQLLISAAQLYGCIVYYGTSVLENFKDSNPAPQYFYGYFVFMNLPWIIVPILLCNQSVQAINHSFSLQQQQPAKAGKAN